MSLITKLGFYECGRGFKHRVLAVDLPGDYPVIAAQISSDGSRIAKDGLRMFTKGGRIYANGSGCDELNLDPDSHSESATKKVRMEFLLGGSRIGGPTEVVEDSDAHDELLSNGWSEVE